MSFDEEALELYVPAQLDMLGQDDFDISSLRWKTKAEGIIRLGDMPDSHLRNAALMLMGLGYQTYKAPDHIKVKWLTAFRLEWERRMYERKETSSASRYARETNHRRD